MKYFLFLDECGDQNLSNFNPDFPVFTLCGVIVAEVQYKKIVSQVNAIKSHLPPHGNANEYLHCKNEKLNFKDVITADFFVETAPSSLHYMYVCLFDLK